MVVPLHDKGPYAARAVASVLRQTWSALELIVVDDGSTDHGPGEVQRCADRRVRLVTQSRAGASAARMRGVSLATSAWIAFLDADDEWRPDFLEKTLALARSAPAPGVVFTNVFDAGRRRPLLRHPPRGAPVPDYFAVLLANHGRGMTSSSVLVRREALLACGGFPLGCEVGEDLDTWARLAWTATVGCVPECLAVYHRVDGSATARGRSPTFPRFVETAEAWLAASRVPERLVPSTRRFAGHVLADHVVELAHAGRGAEARRLLRERGTGPWPQAARAKAWVWARLPHSVLRLGRRLRAGA